MADADPPASFGELVRQHRLDAGLTQAALAERAGISLRAVQDLERSVGRPQRETARRLAEAFALTAERRAQFDRAAAPSPRSRAVTGRDPTRQNDAREGRLGDGRAGPEILDGEQKRVTVLIADVGGLTESVEGFEPDLADRLQTWIVPLLVDVVHRCEGTVSRVGGDGIMALFGAPLAREGDAVRACTAAVALHDAFNRLTSLPDGERGPRLALRVGLASSDVVLRSASNDLYQEYTALGPAVRMATRLGQVAAAGTTLLTSETLRAAEGYIRARPVGPLSAVGPFSAGEAFELIGWRPASTRFQRVVSTRQLTRFVGRDSELAALALALGRAGDGHGQVVALVGDPGVGKSRLIWEATRSARAEGWVILESGAVSDGTVSSYQPAIDLVKAYCQIEARDDGPSVREKVTGRILALDPALAPDLPALLALLDVSVDDAAWDALDPPGRRDRTLAALKRLLLRQSQEAPLLLAFEDLHWIDGETQALLDILVDSLPAARVLLLVSYRPEYAHAWFRRTYYTQLRVDALPTRRADELLGALLGDDAALRSLKQHLIAKSEGNPLFLEESVRSLVEGGALVGERGEYRQARPIDAIRVPDTVQTVLMARIDRLEPAAKRLLQLAAVIGKDVPLSLLQAIVEAPDEEVQGALTRLLATEFMYEAHLFPELVYTFKHALTHEVAYDSLLQDQRRALHARIVDAIEATEHDDEREPDRVAEQADRLGHHALRGHLWQKAVTYLRRAGQRDAARSANRQAATYFQQALEALRHLPTDRVAQELAIDIRLDLRNVLLPLGDMASNFDQLQEAEALAIALGDRWRLGWVSAYLAACYCNTMKPGEAEAAGLRAMALADEHTDFPLQVMSHFFLGLSYVYACRFRESIDLLGWNVDRLQGETAYERFGEPGLPAVFSRSYLMRALAETGRFEEGFGRGDEAVRLSKSTDLPSPLASSLEGLGYVYLRRGEIAQAITLLEQSLQIGEQRQLNLSGYLVQGYLGYAYALAGRDDEAMPLLAESVLADWGLHPALRVAMEGEAHLLAGRPDQARGCVDLGLALATNGEEHGGRAWTLRLAAEIASRQGLESTGQAVAHYEKALVLAEELGMRPLRAHCHLGLGKLHLAVGRPDQARAELATAVAMLGEMGMTFWLPEAEAALAQAVATVSGELTH